MQQYDVATKVLMDKASDAMLETFLGIHAADIEYLEELPQETANLKRSDYIVRVMDAENNSKIVLWEFLSQWKRNAVLSLCDYTVRALIKYALPVHPVVLLFTPSPQAKKIFREGSVSFRFTLIRMYNLSARKFLETADIHLLPFVPAMRGGEKAVWEAETRIYTSPLPSEEKADLLTAMAIFAGLKGKELVKQLVERRRDLMIQSYAYEVIKQEGVEEGIQQERLRNRQKSLDSKRESIEAILEERFELVPKNIIEALKQIDSPEVLQELLRKAITVKDLPGFGQMLKKVLEPV